MHITWKHFARLPGEALRKCLHGSLLMAGYCYGPMDPVSNIIVNTIWCASTFPTRSDFVVAMISTKGLRYFVGRRIECCSLHGLVAFLRALFSSSHNMRLCGYRFPNGPPGPSPALARKGPALSGPALCGPMYLSCRAVSGAVPHWRPRHGPELFFGPCRAGGTNGPVGRERACGPARHYQPAAPLSAAKSDSGGAPRW
jgi:hypothetical protein